MKRILSAIIVLALFVGIVPLASANETVEALLNRGIRIEYDGVGQTMKNEQGTIVYPISYQGSTYLPIRAVSGIMGIGIEWDGPNQTVRLSGEAPRTVAEEPTRGQNEYVSVLINRTIVIEYFGNTQTLMNEQLVQIYPISYQGSTYLPIRAVSGMMGLPISWDGPTQTVSIDSGITPPTDTPALPPPVAQSGRLASVATWITQNSNINFIEGSSNLPQPLDDDWANPSIDYDAHTHAVVINDLGSIPQRRTLEIQSGFNYLIGGISCRSVAESDRDFSEIEVTIKDADRDIILFQDRFMPYNPSSFIINFDGFKIELNGATKLEFEARDTRAGSGQIINVYILNPILTLY